MLVRDMKEEELYQKWKAGCRLNFDSQQEEALKKDGVVLLLAVPGSGKTTTLIGKLGYLVQCMHANPREILSITYTTAAAAHMKEVYNEVFGEESGCQISFLTINSLSWRIVLHYYRSHNREINLLEEAMQRKWIREFLKEINHENFPPEADILNTQTYISQVKNRMMNKEEIERGNWEVDHFPEIFERYQNTLVRNRMADYDDQMIFAMKILKIDPGILQRLRRRYRYICVDESQDTSLLQHRILELLSDGNRLFLVGDEEQSIYGYRGACPEVLLHITDTYPDAQVLKLETNYRSNSEITETARRFVNKNKHRFPKNMHAYRGGGGVVNVIPVKTRSAQMKELALFCKGKGSAAVLYRNNDSAAVLVDYLEHHKIPWSLNKAKDTFFTNRIVTDIRSFFAFALDLDNPELFLRCVTRVSMYFKTERAREAAQRYKINKRALLDEFIYQNKFQKGSAKYQIDQSIENAKEFKSVMKRLGKMKPAEAISQLEVLGYKKYVNDCGLGTLPLENLKMIAAHTDTLSGFLKRLETLHSLCEGNHTEETGIVLSTIHSAKGMEFDRVLLFDVVDGILPGCREGDDPEGYQEERRLFYVAMTRAKNELTALLVKNREHSFVQEIQPKETPVKETAQKKEPAKEAGGKKKKEKHPGKGKKLRYAIETGEKGDYLLIQDSRSGEMIQVLIDEKRGKDIGFIAWKMEGENLGSLCTKELVEHRNEKRWRFIGKLGH
ncbi:MAG: ATP-dependent helicase [Solobacterium sp.]|nr:ATP-dependent helicase [Solobacterium sp.]